MGNPDELVYASATRLAAMLKAREISSVELVDLFIERVESINHRLNAVVTLVEERASREAEEADRRLACGDARPLEGLPISVKDSIATAGVRSTNGMKIFEHFVPAEDAPVVARLRAAGAIVMSKTNVPEMAMDYDCANPVFGATRNPWNLDRVPGGSSGGEAAALAAGMSPLGLGSDFGGSVRVPAHFCGVAALKPSWGTIPASGHLPLTPALPPPIAQMVTLGPMARNVADLTLAYNILRGPHPSWPYTVPSAEAHPERIDARKLRCAVFSAGGLMPVADEVRAATQRAAQALRAAGLAVDEAQPPLEGAGLVMDYVEADGRSLLIEGLGENIKFTRERLRTLLLSPSSPKSAAEFFKLSIARDVFRSGLATFMERYPILLCPPFCTSAFALEALEVEVNGTRYDRYSAGWPAIFVNFAGLPAAVVPAGRDREGLPIGVQIVGRAFAEEEVLAVATILEDALGGFQRPPF